ncbi:hypothetical protein X992_5685 [Burkholderia pseudomallei MSHR5492]|nr:hypothetical protein X992_5685 [Burkholderia pseudomallei MSHR5492]
MACHNPDETPPVASPALGIWLAASKSLGPTLQRQLIVRPLRRVILPLRPARLKQRSSRTMFGVACYYSSQNTVESKK